MNLPAADAIQPTEPRTPLDRAMLSLEGLSVGDALGEQTFNGGQFARALRREIPTTPLWRYTDDTEMALGILEILRSHGAIDCDALAQVFARRHRLQPDRGYGGGAIRILTAIARGESWRDVAPAAFGGQGSMGNGSAMRIAPLGAWFADDTDALTRNATASAVVTHSNAEGIAGAIAIAAAAAKAWSMRSTPAPRPGAQIIEAALEATPESQTRAAMRRALDVPLTATIDEATGALGNGSQIIVLDTVPFALWVAARHIDSYEDAIWSTITAQGDIDTNCAIVGGIVVLATGVASIPSVWRTTREPLKLDS